MKANRGAEDFERGIISIGYKAGDSKHQKSSLLIVPHEVGHLILDNYLTQKLPLLQELQQDTSKDNGNSYFTVAPYHELFADIVQAMYFGSPDINDKASTGFEIEPVKCRTFNQKPESESYSSEPHCALSSVRVELWEKFLKPNLSNKKAILQKIADTILAEIEPQLVAKRSLSITAASNGLLRRLEQNSIN